MLHFCRRLHNSEFCKYETRVSGVNDSFDNQRYRLGEQWDNQASEDIAKRHHQVMYALPDQGMQ
jgi:hypothetical protein